jgi:hypothetical protein
MAYCRCGHFDRVHYLWFGALIVDASKWLGFDLIALFNDSWSDHSVPGASGHCSG